MSVIKKSEAIFFLATSMGKADGELSIDEIKSAFSIPIFAAICNDVDETEISVKIKSGKLNIDSAMAILKQLSKNDRLEAMVVCYSVGISDNVITTGEKELLDKLCVEFGFDNLNEVIDRYK